MMIKINFVILMALFVSSALAQELTIYLDVSSTSTEGVVSYPSENLSFPVRGTDANDKLTRPWFQAFPILGNYTIVEIDEQLIRLQAQTGKGKLLQRLYGKGGLVLLSDLKASGLWRSRANAPLKSFGALSVPALSQLTSKLTLGMSVAIKSLAEKEQVRWFHQKTVDYWLSPQGILVPVPRDFVTTEGFAIVLDSESAQVLTLKIQDSFAYFEKPVAVPFPQLSQVRISVWRIDAELLGSQETNTNAPFIFQQVVPKVLKRGDKVIVVCTERLEVNVDSSLDISKLLSKAQAELPSSFTLLTLKNWLAQEISDPLVTQMFVAVLAEQALRPIEIIDQDIKWAFYSSKIKLENRFFPLIRVFIYSL
jgi:hypothetical protein